MGWFCGATDSEHVNRAAWPLGTRKMRIIYISQYFPPEIGATQTRAFEMARGLVRAGHQVTMITEFPNHPAGIIPQEYRRKLVQREVLNGIDVIRVWVKASPVKTFQNRITFYLSFMVMAIFAGIFFARGKYEAIYATSPPLFVGGAGLFLSYLRRIPLFFEVRDLWPESAVQMGQLNRLWAIRLSTWLEEKCYRRATKIVVVTNGIKKRLLDRGIPESKVTIIPNGANTELYAPRPPSPSLRQKLGLTKDQFVVIYTGLIGLIHGLETILETAELLKSREEIRFIILGDGPQKTSLLQLGEIRSIHNILFHDSVPENELPEYIALADVGLHVQLKLDISKMALPVKMFSYMACERPVLLAIEGEAADLLNSSCAGLVVPPENPQALANAIMALRNDPERCRVFGKNGRQIVEAKYSRRVLADQLARLLEQELN